MKKVLFTTVCAAVLGFSAQSFAENMVRTVPTTTVSEALLMEDNTPVALVGTITQNLGDEKYQFTDNTGTIVVEIDDEDWNGLTPNPNDMVVITGEIDKDGNIVEVDAETVALSK